MLDEMARAGMAITTAPPIFGRIAAHPLFHRLASYRIKHTDVFRILPVTNTIVARRFNPEAPRQKDMLGSLIAHGLDEKQANNEAVLQVMAGSDTTATAIRATMLYIISTPRVYRRLQGKIDEGIRGRKVSSPITGAEAAEMPYLQAVIWEGIRVFSPTNGLGLKIVPPGGIPSPGSLYRGAQWWGR